MQTAPSIKSTTERATVASTYKPVVKLTAHRGWYRVQSGANPSVYYETSANSCTCPARKPCKHMKFVRSLNVAFYVGRKVTAPACTTVEEEHAGDTSCRGTTMVANTLLDAQTEEAEARLAQARRALHDADQRDDSYAVLWRQVDGLERTVAALHWQAMRAA